MAVANSGAAQVTVCDPPDSTSSNSFYVGNRPPLEPSPFYKLPIGSITPRGWLRHQLELERDGMTGHLEEISPWLDFQQSAWANKEGRGQRGWEELPYWLKGYGDLGYVLKDEAIIAEAKKWIDAAISSQREDGWFGPRELLTSLDGNPDLWPHMVMLNVLQSRYESTGDPRIIEVMTGYFNGRTRCPSPHSAAATGPNCASATTSKAFSGSTTAPANRGCWTWRGKFTRHGSLG